MRAGKLRNNATFYNPTSGVNAFGEVNSNHVEVGTYKCSALTLPKSETSEAGAMISKTVYDLRFRYYAELESIDRAGYVVVNGKKLQIKSISNVQLRNRELQMICEELT